MNSETNKTGWRKWLDHYGQPVFDVYLFLNFAVFVGWQTYRTYQAGNLDFVEIAFTVQNVIMVSLILLRMRHRAIDTSFFNQGIAIAAFLSGILLIGQPVTGGATVQSVAKMIVAASNLLGIATLLNLGRSFGILIAFRELKTGGLYSIVRHPMYGTDILLRIGYLVGHLNPLTSAIFVLSTGCYVYRAILEERFLRWQAEYEEYMQAVRYRFIPYVF